MNTPLQIRRLSHALGAELLGLDLGAQLDDEAIATIRKAWLAHGLLLIRGQRALTPGQQVAFTARFGPLDRNDNAPAYRMRGYPEVVEVTNREAEGQPSLTRNLGRSWHSDLEYTLRPAEGSFLWCGEAPEVGGDTMFANMYRAYESLSEGLKKTLAGMDAEYDIRLGVRPQDEDGTFANIHHQTVTVAQPLIRIHAESGRKSLFVSERVDRFVGWTREESLPLLQYLCSQATQPENVFRQQWRPGDLIIWDNRCVIHQALADYDRSQIRYMRRTTCLGPPSGYVVRGDASLLSRQPDAH
ncbi:MAG: TauD/TfdA dioxygenase family protein [Pigmentiphaga sp.]